jgi:hypothetical protein
VTFVEVNDLLTRALASNEVKRVRDQHRLRMVTPALLSSFLAAVQGAVVVYCDSLGLRELGMCLSDYVAIAKQERLSEGGTMETHYALAPTWSFDDRGETTCGEWELVVPPLAIAKRHPPRA